MVKEIKLTQNQIAIVDDEDYNYLSQFKWLAHRTKNGNYYAERYQCKKHNVKMHREILHAQKGEIVDHINHNGLDNRRSNLRICTHAQNSLNLLTPSNNTSGYKGVSKQANRKTWNCSISLNGDRISIHGFKSKHEAASMYNELAKVIHKEYAHLINIPDEFKSLQIIPKSILDEIEDGIKRNVMLSNNTSGYRGVAWDKGSKKWKSSVYSNKKRLHLGYFTNPIEAALAYDEYAIIQHGKKAYLNFPDYI